MNEKFDNLNLISISGSITENCLAVKSKKVEKPKVAEKQPSKGKKAAKPETVVEETSKGKGKKGAKVAEPVAEEPKVAEPALEEPSKPKGKKGSKVSSVEPETVVGEPEVEEDKKDKSPAKIVCGCCGACVEPPPPIKSGMVKGDIKNGKSKFKSFLNTKSFN